MAFHGQENLCPGSQTHDHACNTFLRNISPEHYLIAKLEEYTCVEECVPGSPGSASITDYCVEVGAPSTPANASMTGFSPLIAQSIEWGHGGQQSVQTSPNSAYRANKINRTYSFTPGSRPTAQELSGSENQSLLLTPFDGLSHEKSEIASLSETSSRRFGTLPDDHIIPMTPALGLGESQQQSQASVDSVERYLHSLHDKTSHGIAQDESSDYTMENSDEISEDSESNDESNALLDVNLEGSEIHTNETSAAVLEIAKKALINQIMQEFWIRFDKNWVEKCTTCAGSETAPNPPSKQTASLSAQATVLKRQRQEADDENFSSDDNGRAHKRLTPQQISPDGVELALSCPFRKHDPGKEHIYRSHRVPLHCTRCGAKFESYDLLESHTRDESNICRLRPIQAFDGITPKTERLLRSRKKEYKGQADAEIWRKTYSILFPDEYVPSPYYQIIRDEPDAQEHAIYHAYLRRTIPRLFKARIEALVDSQCQAFIDTIKTLLDETMHDCIDQAWIEYEIERGTRDPVTTRTGVAVLAPMESTLSEVLRTHKQNVSISSVPELQSGFEHVNSFNQSPGPPPTPGDPAPADGCYKANDMDVFYCGQNALFDCFCPINACNCAYRETQTQLLPPATLEFNTPGKTLEKGMLGEEWKQDGPLVAGNFGEYDFRTDWEF